MTRVEIDLNCRVEHNWTLAGVEDVEGRCVAGEPVEVYESESGVTGPGRIERVDEAKRLVYVWVDWPALR